MLGRASLVMRCWLGAGLEDFDDDHATAAGRTCELVFLRFIDGISSLGIGRWAFILSGQKTASQGDIVGTVAIGEKAVVADAVESFWKDVDQEAPDEFMDIEGHDLVALRPLGSIILPGEGDGLVVDADEPTVGDGDPVGIAGEIGEHRHGPGERLLGMNRKVDLVEGLEIGIESRFRGKRLVVVEELETTIGMSLFEAFENQASEQT